MYGLDPKSKPGSPRALAQKLSGDALEDDEEEGDEEESTCQVRVCQKMIEDLQLKLFSIEENLQDQIDVLKVKLEGRLPPPPCQPDSN
jgi:hypothetical protein